MRPRKVILTGLTDTGMGLSCFRLSKLDDSLKINKCYVEG